jgi:hypothetical protein
VSGLCKWDEIVCDIVRKLYHCEDGDPNEVYSPIQDQILSTPLIIDSSTSSVECFPLTVDVPIELLIGKVDNHIDLIVVILGDPDNISHDNTAAAFPLELVSCPPRAQ